MKSWRERSNGIIVFLLFTSIVAFILTLVFTYPLIFKLNQQVPGYRAADSFSHMWSLWWFEKAIFDLNQSPAQLTHIYFPQGAFHPKEITSALSKAVALPFILNGISPVLAYNINVILSYVLTWVLMTWLCYELTNSKSSALIAGAIFTFASNRTMHVLSGHYTQLLMYPSLILALILVWFWKLPNIRRALLLGFALAAAALIDLMPLFYVTMPVLLMMMCYFMICDRKKILSTSSLKYFFSAVGLALIIIIPFYWSLFTSAFSGDLEHYRASGAYDFSADGLGFFIPPPGNLFTRVVPRIGHLSNELFTLGVSYSEATVYIGFITMLLVAIALLALWEKQRDIRMWFTFSFVWFIFSLGPLLRVNSKLIKIGESAIYLPYSIFLSLPIFSWGRTPARFNGPLMFALAIMSAYAIHYLLKKIKNSSTRYFFGFALLFLIFVDSVFFWPWKMFDSRVPAYLTQIAADERAVAVLDVPVLDYVAAKQHLLFQMAHGHAIVGGFRERIPPEAKSSMMEIQSYLLEENVKDLLRNEGIGYVILHSQFLETEKISEFMQNLNNQLGLPVYQDEQVIIYVVSDALPISPRPVNPALGLIEPSNK